MAYTVKNADGDEIAGDPKLDDILRASALLVNGWIEDESGAVVYESPRRIELREAGD